MRKLQKARGVISSTPQIRIFQDGSVLIERSFEGLRYSFSLLAQISFQTQHLGQGYLNAMRFTPKYQKVVL